MEKKLVHLTSTIIALIILGFYAGKNNTAKRETPVTPKTIEQKNSNAYSILWIHKDIWNEAYSKNSFYYINYRGELSSPYLSARSFH